MLKRKWFRVILLLGVVVGLAQLYRPPIPAPPVTGDFDGPAEVKQILQTSCYACHSNESKLAWFDHINPAYLLARSHIMEGRSYLNFSHWDSLNPNQKRAKLFDVLNVVKTFDRMPRKDYLLLHPGARLDSVKISVLERYILSLEKPVQFNPAAMNTSVQNDTMVQPESIKDAPNGIAFIADYKTWEPVSSTERFDNNSFRLILANPVAAKAIRDKQNNPYPDGASLAKVVWQQKALPNGILVPGDFMHVEFMIKNSKEYADTEGWGWARWKGEKLIPHGATPLIVNECINCHKPVRNTDFVFTKPFLK